MTRLAVLVALLLALTGCATGPVTASPSTSPSTTSPVVVSAPPAVTIPAIGASSTLVPLGLDDTGAMVVPPVDQPQQASWFEPGVIPGQPGPAAIAGHVNGRVGGESVPGVFARLVDLQPGDEILVDRAGAEQLAFEVYRVEDYGKAVFPTEVVYGDVDAPELRVITCGGTFDPVARSYEDNVVVFARLR